MSTEIAQHISLDVRPHQFDRIQFWCVGWEEDQGEAFVASHERLSRFCVMRSRVIQHHDDVPLNLAQQMLKEPGDVRTANRPGFGVLEEASVRGDSAYRGELLPVRSEPHQGRNAPG